MSQFSLRNIREIPNDPFAKFTNQLAKRLSVFLNKNEIDKLENKEDIYSDGQDIDSVIKFHSLNSTKYFDFVNPYYPPFEPDLDKLKMWVRGYNLGNELREWSGFNEDLDINGDPILIDGTPFDYGIHSGGTKSTALRMNRPTSDFENDEHISTGDPTGIRILGASTGLSWFFRIRVFATDLEDGKRRTLYLKTDDNPVSNGIRVSIDPTNKKWVIQIKKGGTFITKETAANKILTNIVYDAFITLDFSGNVVKLYLAKTGDSSPTDETLSNSAYTEEWGPDLTDFNGRLFKRGPASSDGHVYGDLFDFKVYSGLVVSSAQAGYHWNNKWTIADIPFGQVMVTDYWATYIVAGAGFDSTGFDSTGFDT